MIPVANIEPRIDELAGKYSIVELNTALKPRAFEYLLGERDFGKAIYLDPDIKIFHSLSTLDAALDRSSILLTPHICTPIPFDGRRPTENMFLNFGVYNLGFIGVAGGEGRAGHVRGGDGIGEGQESLRFLRWWKDHTYRQGYIDTHKGIFVDQLPINHVPVFFNDVAILRDPGLNMAPWNLHERRLSVKEGMRMVNEVTPLIFYHFSCFRSGPLELPLHLYDRYTLVNRPDLQDLYREYGEDLNKAGHAFYSRLPCYYDRAQRQKKSSALSRFFFHLFNRKRK